MGTRGVGRSAALAALASACIGAWPATASALEPGVHVAPGSPAEKEYALPLNQARQTGGAPSPRRHESSAPRDSTSAGSGEAALFGAGIKPPSGGSGGGSGTGRASAGKSGAGRSPGAGRTPTALTAAGSNPAITRALRDSGGGDDSSTLALIG